MTLLMEVGDILYSLYDVIILHEGDGFLLSNEKDVKNIASPARGGWNQWPRVISIFWTAAAFSRMAAELRCCQMRWTFSVYSFGEMWFSFCFSM